MIDPAPAIDEPVPSSPAQQVHALLADAAAHYRDALRASPQAVQYLAGRGIGGAIAARFGLGFARPKWRDLLPVLERYDDAVVEASGLLASSGEGAAVRRFDRLRDRVTFPIRTRSGDVAGFGGRAIGAGDDPKYMNSPEGVVFRKRELLYGLFEAEAAIQVERYAVVVEGYFDVVALAQAGCLPVVGTLGTACSREQLELLLSVTDRLVFCFDGDAAGRRAAARGMETVLPLAVDGRVVQFVFLPDDHDPDSFVRAHGVEAFGASLQGAVSLFDFIVECITTGCDFAYAEGRALCAHRAKGMWQQLPDGSVRGDLLRYCAGVLRLPEAQVLDLWTR